MGLINKTALVTRAITGIGYHSTNDLYHLPDKITQEFKKPSLSMFPAEPRRTDV